MKNNVRPLWPAPPKAAPQPTRPVKELSAITLALLDEYAFEGEGQGYDPYNATIPPGALQLRKRG